MFKNKGSHFKAILSLTLAVIFGGGNAVLVKIGLKEIPLFTFTFLRFLISFILLLPFFLREKPKLGKDTFQALGVSILIVVNFILFAFGVRLTTVVTSQAIYVLTPIIVVIFSSLLIKEKTTKQKIAGIIIGLIGALIIILLPEINKGSNFIGDTFGNLLILMGAVSFALYSVLSKKLQRKYSPITINMFSILTAMTVTLGLAIYEFTIYPNWWSKISLFSIEALLYTSIFGTFLFYILYQYVIKHGTPLIASIMLYLIPVLTFLWAAVLLGERLTPAFIIGAILAISGAYIVTKKSKTAIVLPSE